MTTMQAMPSPQISQAKAGMNSYTCPMRQFMNQKKREKNWQNSPVNMTSPSLNIGQATTQVTNRIWIQPCSQMERFDDVLKGLLETWQNEDGIILLTSDHGNMEDLSTRRHTAANVPLLLFGDKIHRREFQKDIHDLTGIAPAISKILDFDLIYDFRFLIYDCPYKLRPSELNYEIPSFILHHSSFPHALPFRPPPPALHPRPDRRRNCVCAALVVLQKFIL